MIQQVVTLSEKYQVVIPKAVRKDLGLKPGQRLRVSKNKAGNITISTNSGLDELYGSMKGAWGKDSTKWLEQQRAEANRDRT